MARACGTAAEGEARRRRARARARYLSLELAHGRVVVDVDVVGGKALFGIFVELNCFVFLLNVGVD